MNDGVGSDSGKIRANITSSGVLTLWSRWSGLPILLETLMDEYREILMAGIKDQIEQGNYVVDARAVADAILRHIRALAAANTERPGEAEPVAIRCGWR